MWNTLVDLVANSRSGTKGPGNKSKDFDLREKEYREIWQWAHDVDKYLGSVADYSAFKREPFEEIEVADPAYLGKWPKSEKFVKVGFPLVQRDKTYTIPYGHVDEWDMHLLAKLKDKGECVAFVHYIPLQQIGPCIYIGGYGTPIRKAVKK